MAAQDIEAFVVVVENQEWSNGPLQVVSLENSSEFHYRLDGDIRTLSSDTVQTGDTITGFLYVPDIDKADVCSNIAQQFIPANATRRADLPGPDFNLIGLVPWISANCTRSYLESAHGDLIKALLIYPTTHQSAEPPDLNDPAWGLQDNAMIRSQNNFPIYAIPGQAGDQIMLHLSRFSGNMTDVESADNLTSFYDPRDYVRLYASINTGTQKSAPSFWIFLVIIFGILLASVVLIYFTLRWVQRKRRLELRSRVANGEVDLEALGIKRLQVPAEVVEKMPIFIYTAQDEQAETSNRERERSQPPTEALSGNDAGNHSSSFLDHSPDPGATYESASSLEASQSDAKVDDAVTSMSTSSDDSSAGRGWKNEFCIIQDPRQAARLGKLYSQSTCAICLEDFDHNRSTVRQLPCGHIFHPDCVDTFLSESSSLCPICKKSVLPKGCCPTEVTDSMVRRERQVRRLRERIDPQFEGSSPSEIPRRAATAGGGLHFLGWKLRGIMGGSGRFLEGS
ncbi:hypothetical protein L228DRAFT_247659 [Xylona heveae TC161]|uniref:RING-type domain-containing protein n=1 Tax=Xylona heveae (strain CBS 132557 / TC161) TaxID=1328760 RepID=A0A165GD43_XYLHT|nr:hypothetical protein L228DRAFT_247659 [Xylona heveae TC161]KZF22046.1 hypothetical protein L228DRAFT_247659 [Xylona heveae TC161]